VFLSVKKEVFNVRSFYSPPVDDIPDLSLRDDLCRLARFGANLADAYSCFIFLPHDALSEIDPDSRSMRTKGDDLIMLGHHTLSSDVLIEQPIPPGYGLIGWVASNHRSIHVSPFDRDSRTLGVYSEDQQLKSFIGIPIILSSASLGEKRTSGVIACDSKKAYAFSKIQGKLLEELSWEVSTVVRLYRKVAKAASRDSSWDKFLSQGRELVHVLGANSVEVIRLKLRNFSQLESRLGTSGATSLISQVHRLIEQTVPPHFPMYRTPTGDLILCVDNMMSSYFENKIHALCEHISQAGRTSKGLKPLYSVSRRSPGKSSVVDLEAMVADTADASDEPIIGKGAYG